MERIQARARSRVKASACQRHPATASPNAVRILRLQSRPEHRMLLMIDNYDSFTYNLVQYLGELGEEIKVRRNDEITLAEIAQMAPSQIVI